MSVGNVDEVMELIDIGFHNRATGQTDANQNSSRSHAVLTLFVSKMVSGFPNENTCGKFSFIDLAGSERITFDTVTQNSRQR